MIVEKKTIQDLEIIIKRLRKGPLNVARSELEMFCRILKKDHDFMTFIEKVRQEEPSALGPWVATLVKNPPTFGDLASVTTPSSRAAVGYQVCVVLLDYKIPKEFRSKLMALGLYYFAQKGKKSSPSYSDGMQAFVETLLEPLVVYLKSEPRTKRKPQAEHPHGPITSYDR